MRGARTRQRPSCARRWPPISARPPCRRSSPAATACRAVSYTHLDVYKRQALGRAFPELPPEVLAAVERHTLGAVDMSDLDMIVYIADALEPGRKGKMVQKLREKVGELELRDLFLEVYAYWVQLIMERRHPMYSLSLIHIST